MKNRIVNTKGVGLTVIRRFEDIGIDSFEALSRFNAAIDSANKGQ
jgi:hypothetical protein